MWGGGKEKKGAFCCIATSNLVCFRLNIAQWLPSFWLWWWMITDQVRLVSDFLHSLHTHCSGLFFVLFTFSIWNLAFHETFSNKKSCTCTEASKHALTKVKQYMYQRKQTCPWCWTVCGPKKQSAFADKASQLMQTCIVGRSSQILKSKQCNPLLCDIKEGHKASTQAKFH